MRQIGRFLTLGIAGVSLFLAACSGSGDGNNAAAAKGGAGGRGGNSGPPEVGFVVVQPTSVPITAELPGRAAAFQTAEVRPQVAGLIRQRYFTEGAIVRQGQTLYQIDPRLYRAATNEAQANLQSARANAEATRVRADRYRPLAEMEAVSRQDYTDAVGQARQARAQVGQTQAQLETARVNLSFTRVPAPITGRIGRSLFTEGALVTTNQADPLAVIQRLDPIFVDIQQSAADVLRLRQQLASGGASAASAEVRLKLEDGSDFGRVGTIQFAEALVDQATGTVTLRARFPNPDGILLPGMFVRAMFNQAVNNQAFLVPQQALTRDPRGVATVWVITSDNKAERREVTAGRTQGAFWVVTAGLNAGDRVIVQGTANVRAGQPVRPVPADAPQRIAPPQQSGQGQSGGNQSNGAGNAANTRQGG